MADTTYTITIRGIRPLLMHNGRLCDPMDPATKALKAASARRNKSDDDHGEVSRVEYIGSLYHDPKIGPYLPADVLQAVVERGAMKRKLGKIAKAHIDVLPPEDAPGYEVDYKGPRDVERLFATPAHVLRCGARVNKARVVRTRPRFPAGWRCTFRLEVLDGGMTKEQVKQAVEDAGLYEGVGDWRPRYGRFVVEKI